MAEIEQPHVILVPVPLPTRPEPEERKKCKEQYTEWTQDLTVDEIDRCNDTFVFFFLFPQCPV